MKRLGMSERQYAAYAGITRGAVSKARLSGRLVLHPDGSIDAGKSDQRRASTTDPSQQRGRHAPNLRPVPQAAVGAVAETLEEQGLPAPQASGMTFLQARTANEVIQARLRRMEREAGLLGRPEAARELADICVEMIERGRGNGAHRPSEAPGR